MKKIFYIISALFLVNANATGQCFSQLNFTYVEGSSGTINFTPIISGGTLPYSYNWTFYYGNNSALSNPSFTYPVNDSFMVCLSVIDSNGCYDSICNIVGVTTAPPIKCTGSASFVATANGDSTDFTFSSFTNPVSIDFGDYSQDYSSSTNPVTHVYRVNGNYTVRAIAYTSAGAFTIPCDTFTQTINVNNVPCHADFIEWVDSIYQNGTLQYGFSFINLSTGSNHSTLYLNGNKIPGIDSINSFYPLPPGKYNICIVIDGPGGCHDSICKIDSLVYIPSCGNLDFTYAGTGTCDSYQFTTDNTGSPLNSVEWFLDGISVSNLNNPVINLDFSSSSTVSSHIVSVIGKRNGCQSNKSFSFSNPANFLVVPDTLGTTSHIYYLYPIYSSSTSSEIWDFGDGTNSTLPYPSHTYSSPGTYTVCHHTVLLNGCSYDYCFSQYFNRMEEQNSNTVTIIVVNPNGIDQFIKKSKTQLAPNPVSNFLNISSSFTSLIITNLLGQQMFFSDKQISNDNYQIDVSNFPNGIYFLHSQSGNEVSETKFVVQH